MGNFLSAVFNRLFYYPLQKRRFCVYRQSDYSLSGEFIGNDVNDQTLNCPVESNYEKLVYEFNKKLLEKRREYDEKKRRNGREADVVLRQFSDWTETTVSYLHTLFLTFCNEENKMLDYKAFICVLECLGDETTSELRKNYFNYVDNNEDGFVDYSEYLYMIYNFDDPTKNMGKELRNKCVLLAEKIQQVSKLSVAKQLEYGIY